MPIRPTIAHKVITDVPGYPPEVKTSPGSFYQDELERAAAYREHVQNLRAIKQLRAELAELRRLIEMRRGR